MKIKKLLFLIFFLIHCSALAAEKNDQAISIEEFLQSLSTVPGVIERRDPFQAAKPPFEAVKSDSEISTSAPPLERYQVEQYTVVATMVLNNRNPRALIKLPEAEKGKVLMVKRFDKLGNRGGKIVEINETGIQVLQNQRSALGFVDKAIIVLPVGGVKSIEGEKK